MRNETDNADVPPFLTLMAEKYTGIRKTYVSDSSGSVGDFPRTGRAYTTLKEKNRTVTSYNKVLGRSWLKSMPTSVQLNNIGFCNLRCPMCPTHGTDAQHARYQAKSYTMSRETIDRIAEESFPYAGQCSTSGIGEGLLHKDLDAIIAQASRYGTRLFINSNGTSLGVASFHRLFGITELQLSIDGALPATFEAIRKGADYSKTMRAIRVLKRANDCLPNTLKMRPSINFLVCASNIRELPMMIDLAAYLGAQSLTAYRMMLELNNQFTQEDFGNFPAYYKYYYMAAMERAAANGIHLTAPAPVADIVADRNAGPPNGGVFAEFSAEDSNDGPPVFEDWVDADGVEEEAVELASSVLSHALERHTDASDADYRMAVEQASGLVADLEQHYAQQFAALSPTEQATIRGSHESETEILDCLFLHKALYFEADGRARPCCIYDMKAFVGDAKSQTVAEIFRGPTLEKFNTEFRAGNLCDDCQKCDVKAMTSLKSLFGN